MTTTNHTETQGPERAAQWTKEFPKVDGYYWWAISGEVRLLEVILGQREAWTQGDAENQWDKAYHWTGKFLGPISPEAVSGQRATTAVNPVVMRAIAEEIAAWTAEIFPFGPGLPREVRASKVLAVLTKYLSGEAGK